MQAQECIGLHRALPGTQAELTGQYYQPGVLSLGLGVSRGRFFGLAETATDPVTGSDLMSLQRAGLSVGAQWQAARTGLCVGATGRRDENEESPAVRTSAVGGMVAIGYRLIDAARPLIVFGQVQLESQRETIAAFATPATTQTGTAARIGAAYRFGDGYGIRTFIDFRETGQRVGASISMLLKSRGPAMPADADRDGVPDSLDRCPATPTDQPVDAQGCARIVDSDGDGVPDAADRCPNTPAGTRVDASGCEPDADQDGVPDSRDRCPNTPAGARVNADGCQPDGDGDGIPDVNDRCPNTPAGTPVTATGCVADADGDGIPDSRDKCPDTAAGTAIDADGCAPTIFDQGPIRLDGVTFATGTAELTAASSAKLDELAAILLGRDGLRLEISGHTDSTGNATRNEALSLARANAVRSYLIDRGVSGDRLEARGYGSRNPVATNATAAGRAQNRRVEAKRID